MYGQSFESLTTEHILGLVSQLRPDLVKPVSYTHLDVYKRQHLINKYMDIYKADPKNLAAKAKAEKYSKILAKTCLLYTSRCV